jgi:hypothetical protein
MEPGGDRQAKGAGASACATGQASGALKDGRTQQYQRELRGRPRDGETNPKQVIADRRLEPLGARRAEHEHRRDM